MKVAPRTVLSGIAAAWLAAAPAARAEIWRNHFEADAQSRPPAFFDLQVLGEPGRANWMVLADHNPPSAPNQVTQTLANRPEGSVAVAVRRNVTFQDGKLSVALKKLPAHAGLVFREASEKDFLLLLLDGKNGESVLFAYRDGKRTELAHGKAVLDRDWGFLVVSLSGRAITAAWNEKALLEAADARPVAGRSGLATAGAGIAAFDEFIIETPEAKPAK
jgi:hypothetical protein